MRLLNFDQRKALSQFFNGVAVAWFAAFFSVPVIEPQISVLTMLQIIANIVGALGLSLYVLKD